MTNEDFLNGYTIALGEHGYYIWHQEGREYVYLRAGMLSVSAGYYNTKELAETAIASFRHTVEANSPKAKVSSVTELPYAFDLDWDIKTMDQVNRIANGESGSSYAEPEDLVEMFISLGMPLPESLKSYLRRKEDKIDTTFSDTLINEDIPKHQAGARDSNVGKSNYADKQIQPYDLWIEYQLDPFRADLVKRILRTKEEEGMTLREAKLLDLHKMKHIIETMIGDYDNDNFPWDPILEGALSGKN